MHGKDAQELSQRKVGEAEERFVVQFGDLIDELEQKSKFYELTPDTYEECLQRLQYLKQVIENNDGYRFFYINGKPIEREADMHILYRLTWFGTPSDFNSEVDNGRGPVDFKASRGNADKTLVEFKLASNSKLKQNLQHQVEIYKRANNTSKALKAIFYFSEAQLNHVREVLVEVGLATDKNILLIDCRNDNKPSGSKAKSSI